MMNQKRCALYIRVSTDRQSRVEEGSLKNQEQMLENFVKMKHLGDDEDWEIVDCYIDKGKSAKDTNRIEYQRMLEDIRSKRVNTVLCTALSRISRSTRDLLDMVDWLNKQKVDFICLKENFDTTTAQGKCFITIMAALNQFEREQTSERTRINMVARAQRGLSQGCYILGYDVDSDKKGHFVVNEKESLLVNLIYDSYIEQGSVKRVAETLNKKGYVSKKYQARTGIWHGGKRFCYGAVLNVLNNLAYIGKREVFKKNKSKSKNEVPEDQRYDKFDAVWPAIISDDKFEKAQALLKENFKHRNNGAKPTKHFYLLNGGLLSCHKCGSMMGGRNGHGRGNRIYYYYYCTNRSCRFKVPEIEVELAIQRMLQAMASSSLMLHRIVDKVNAKFREQLPVLKDKRRNYADSLHQLTSEAQAVMKNFMSIDSGKCFVEQRLADLETQADTLRIDIKRLDGEIGRLENEVITEDRIRKALCLFGEIFSNHIKPFQKRILVNWVLRNIKINDNEISTGFDVRRFTSDIMGIVRSDMVPNVKRGSQYKRAPFEVLFYIGGLFERICVEHRFAARSSEAAEAVLEPKAQVSPSDGDICIILIRISIFISSTKVFVIFMDLC